MLTSHEQAPTHTDCGCGSEPACDTLVALERPRWFGRQIVGPEDLTQEQEYLRARARRHNRMLHGWGVVCGLRVRAGEAPCELMVEAGYALDPCGEEIFVPETVSLDACREEIDGAAVSPCGADPWCGDVPVARDPEHVYYLAIRYVEGLARPVLAYGDACAAQPVCEYSRRRDGYELRVLDALPAGQEELPLLGDFVSAISCARGARTCPPSHDSAWVILADLRIQGRAVTVECFPHRRYAASMAGVFFRCRPDLAPATDPLLSQLGAPRSTMLTDTVAGEVTEPPTASVAVRLPIAGMRTLPVHFEVRAGETYAELLAREGGRVFTADSGERFTLADAFAVAGVDPGTTVSGAADALRPLEALELRPDDLLVTRRALEDLVDDAGRKRLADDHAGAPARAIDLPATDLMGVSAKGKLAGSLAGMTIADVAATDRDEFVTNATAGARGAALARLSEQAGEVWVTADRARRLAAAWPPA